MLHSILYYVILRNNKYQWESKGNLTYLMFQLGGVGCNDPDQSQVMLYASFIHHTIFNFNA